MRSRPFRSNQGGNFLRSSIIGMYSRQHLKPSTSDRPGRSYTRLCGVSTTSAAMRQDFKTPRDLNQWTHESEGHMTRGEASEPLHPEQNTRVVWRGMNRALGGIYGQPSERTTQWCPSGTERRYFSYPIKAIGCWQQRAACRESKPMISEFKVFG